MAAHRRLDDLPPALAVTVRSRVGYPVAKESVLARPPVRDRWAVLGYVDLPDYQVTTRRVWLRGEATGRWVLLLSFAAGGADLDASVMPGVTLDADVHLYPGAGQHRGLVGDRARPRRRRRRRARSRGGGGGGPVRGAARRGPVGGAAARRAARGAAAAAGRHGAGWLFRDEDGDAVPLVAGAEAWPLLARSMGDPVEVPGSGPGRASCRSASCRTLSTRCSPARC